MSSPFSLITSSVSKTVGSFLGGKPTYKKKKGNRVKKLTVAQKKRVSTTIKRVRTISFKKGVQVGRGQISYNRNSSQGAFVPRFRVIKRSSY